MAFSDTTAQPATPLLKRVAGAASRVFSGIGATALSVCMAIANASEMQARADRVTRLRSLSDDDLRKMGIARDDIVAYVFRDKFYI